MRLRTAIERKKHATSELAPSPLALPGDNFESSTSTAPQSAGHSFSNLSVVRPQAKLTASQSGEQYEDQGELLADQMMWMEKTAQNFEPPIPQIAPPEQSYTQRYSQRTESPAPGPQVTSKVESARGPSVGRNNIQENAGNLAVQRMFQGGLIQAKLSISQPCDAYEQEADRVANQVMHMSTPLSAGMCHDLVQPQTPNLGEVAPAPGLAANITQLVERAPSDSLGQAEAGDDFEARLGANDGSPLSPDTRAFMEPRFGADFSRVRVHTGSEAAQLSRSIHAQAFTCGEHIYLGEGQSDVGSSSEKTLLAHELTHSIQQGAAGTNLHRMYSPLVSTSPIVQRDPLLGPPVATAPTPAPAPGVTPPTPVPPGATPPAPATTDKASSGGWSLRGILDGSQKVAFPAGNHNIYHDYKGENFDWSTDEKTATGSKIAIPLGTIAIPVPPPVGLVLIEAEGSAAVYAGGSALIDVSLNDVVVELTTADIAKIGGLAVLGTIGGLLPALALLQGVKLYGKATFDAKALAKLTAGAKLDLALAVGTVWPVKGFVSAGLGITGEISALAYFNRKDVPIVLDFIGPIPRFRALNLKLNPSSGVEFSAKFGLSGHLAIGVELGYGLIRRELFHASYNPNFNLNLRHAISGGTPETLSTSDDGTPEIDLPKIYLLLKDLASALIAGTERNDNATPADSTGTGSTGKAPVGSDEDPVLIYWCKPEGIYKNPIYLDDEEGHENTPYYRYTEKLLDRSEDMTIGVRYWPRRHDKITKQKGVNRIEQKRFMKVLELHHFEGGRSDLWNFSPDHVLDIGLGGNEADRIGNLWPAERTANEAAGFYHGHQGVWLRTGDEEPKNPTALHNIPDGTVMKIREIVMIPPLEPPKP